MLRATFLAAAAQLMRVSSGGLPEIRGVLPRRRASSRTPLASWAPPNWHLGTSLFVLMEQLKAVIEDAFSKSAVIEDCAELAQMKQSVLAGALWCLCVCVLCVC
eukprot:COSAG05_NODE_1680_length_4291_cov_2.546040_4_plen_104_part_00